MNHLDKDHCSFRSGRYGFNEAFANTLIENYLVDSSVTPYTDWSANKGISDFNGGPDFLKNPCSFDYLSGERKYWKSCHNNSYKISFK